MCVLYNTGSVDVNIEAVSALSNAHQLNNYLVDNSTLECFIIDGASDDRAVKCCISNHYHHNGRRRSVLVETTAQSMYTIWDTVTDNQSFLHKCLTNTMSVCVI